MPFVARREIIPLLDGEDSMIIMDPDEEYLQINVSEKGIAQKEEKDTDKSKSK